ncbi:hypothetical protein SAMN05443575_3427 [Jatrophihabitans endophyticus]|uniref:Uncharacterized protein n=1 Tax=Jatrophihabitans endophyticus TaxID=1206085 RepID=A0A1M5R3P4_9ACTN|nr:hypothetical protein [Jatrophihabitans endophyticus]SHH20640.1 hypothetical protein SAMN05443575_3427 [Jatrophihabitans endophyticus]
MTDPTDPRDPTAGPGADATSTRADRSLTWWPLVGAAVIAGLVALLIATVGGNDERAGRHVDSAGALSCPSTYHLPYKVFGWVPTDAAGVDGKKSLVPDARPSHVTVCRYDAVVNKTTDADLGGHVTLTEGLAAAATELSRTAGSSSEPQPITEPIGRHKDTVYLAGFTFATGIVWVSTYGGGVSGATNGQFHTTARLQERLATAYRTRAWS